MKSLLSIIIPVLNIENYIVEVSTNEIGTDEILIKASTKAKINGLDKLIKDHFRARLRVSPSIEFLSFEEIEKVRFPAKSRKPVVFFDKRSQIA